MCYIYMSFPVFLNRIGLHMYSVQNFKCKAQMPEASCVMHLYFSRTVYLDTTVVQWLILFPWQQEVCQFDSHEAFFL